MAPKSAFTVVARELTRPGADEGYGSRGRSAWLDVDWAAHTHRMTVDGASVNYVDIGEGDDDPVVFIHGLGACWQTWLENLPHFARDRRCIAMDLPGFGASPMPAEEISIERYAAIVDDLHCSYDKVSRCVELGIDVLVDDAPVTLRRARELGIVGATILHPWNAELCERGGCVCGADWPELAAALEPVLRDAKGIALLHIEQEPL